MDPRQVERADRLLFDFCLTHSRRVYEAEAPIPATLPPREARAMVHTARLLYRAMVRCQSEWSIPSFPLQEAVIGPRIRVVPPFWVRFDGFLRAGGGFFFAELNGDRPGGHREAMAYPGSGGAFRRRFALALRQYWNRWGARARGKAPRTAFLIDPAHREEMHIAHLYAGLLEEMGWPCTVVGPLNLSTAHDQALAFGEPVDLLLRQFPTEFAHEVPAFADLTRLHDNGRLLLLNDPATIRLQAKSSFAWLWEQVMAGGGQLTREEVGAVIRGVPFTSEMTSSTLPTDPRRPDGERLPTALALLGQPERWLLKPSFGRYSQGVLCGALAVADEWGAAVAAALAQPEYWVAQQYVAIAPQGLFRWNAGQCEKTEGYVNWGLHLLMGSPAGWMARCSRSPITDDHWFAPVVLADAFEREGGTDGALVATGNR